MGKNNTGFLTNVAQISLGGDRACALTNVGEVLCWGRGINGELGLGVGVAHNTDIGGGYTPSGGIPWPVKVVDIGESRNGQPLRGITQVEIGYSHVCALNYEGNVLCWGLGSHGRLGQGETDTSIKWAPVIVLDTGQVVGGTLLTNIKQISAGGAHTCALNTSNQVLCWGYGSKGRLGVGNTTSYKTPQQVRNVGSGTASLTGVEQVAAGYSHTCALKIGGALLCWGNGSDGALGYDVAADPLENKTRPVTVTKTTVDTFFPAPTFFEKISAGSHHTCSKASDGEVHCWGYGTSGQLGDVRVSSDEPVQVHRPASHALYEYVSAGGYHSCGLTDNGKARCWGLGGEGQLGSGEDKGSKTPVTVKDSNGADLTGLTQVSAGEFHTCALNEDVEVLCWGSGDDGRLGNGASDNQNTPVNVLAVSGAGNLSRIKQVSAGKKHTCALNGGGKVYCWGANNRAQLGVLNTTTTSSNRPVEISDLTDVIQISIGGEQSCALKKNGGNGQVVCWGYNNVNSSSHNTRVIQTTDSTNLIYAKQVSVGENYACAIWKASASANSKKISCWGQGGDHIGVANASDSTSAYLVDHPTEDSWSTFGNVAQISAGNGHTCALMNNGDIYCWGDGERGALGNKLLTSTNRARLIASPKPTRKFNDKDLLRGKIAVGTAHSCAVTQNKNVYCWGEGDNGRLGMNSTSDAKTPDLVHGTSGSGTLDNIYQVKAGDTHSCSLTMIGKVHCWGDGSSGKLGQGTETNSNFPKAVISGETATGNNALTNARQISVGRNHTCVLRSNQQVACWGKNEYGELGANLDPDDDEFVNSPVLVHTSDSDTGPLSDVIQVSAGRFHTCALKNNGKVYCWGRGEDARLGQGSSDQNDKTTPVVVSGTNNSDMVQIATGSSHTCALKSHGEVYCWGIIGTGTKNTPVKVGSASAVERLSAGSSHNCAIQTRGRAYCWGLQAYGSLGNNNNSSVTKNTPISVKDIGGSGYISGVLDIDSNDYHSCVLKKGGLVACWGQGSDYQLGNDSNSSNSYPTLAIREDRKEAGFFSTDISPNQQISTYYEHACALKNDGTPLCWGQAGHHLGQSNTTNNRKVPGVVLSLRYVVKEIDVGQNHTCARKNDNTVACWGYGGTGSLGEGSTSGYYKNPRIVQNHSGNSGNLTGVQQLSAGYLHSCAVLSDGKVACWGANTNGELGDNSTTTRSTPVLVQNEAGNAITGVSQVAAGHYHSCATRTNGKVYCWGYNGDNQVSSGSSTNYQYARTVKYDSSSDFGGAIKVGVGGYSSCAIKIKDGEKVIRCWGIKLDNRLGSGYTSGTQSYASVNVLAPGQDGGGNKLTGVIDLEMGDKSSCALLKSQKVVCWGGNANRILGSSATGTTTRTQWVLGGDGTGQLGGVIGINVGRHAGCALKIDGRILCWGRGSNYLMGDNDTSNHDHPQPVLRSTDSTDPFLVD